MTTKPNNRVVRDIVLALIVCVTLLLLAFNNSYNNYGSGSFKEEKGLSKLIRASAIMSKTCRDNKAIVLLNSLELENYELAVKMLKRQIESSEFAWNEARLLRHAYVESHGQDVSKVNEWDIYRGMYLWDFFTPSYTCPYDVTRVGRIGDGGKWICGFKAWYDALTAIPNEAASSPIDHKAAALLVVEPGDLANVTTAAANISPRENCVIYSIGVRDDSSFEEEIIDRTLCKVFAYDFSVDGMAAPQMKNNSRVKFQKLGLGAKNEGHFRTLSKLMNDNGHSWIDIFKVDIEGSEYEVFDEIINAFPKVLPFGQLLIEIHADFEKPISKIYPWWERLEAHGLRAFWTEVNHNPCVRGMAPVAVEYGFINVNSNPDLKVPPPIYYSGLFQ